MVTKDNACLTDTVTTESKVIPSHDNNSGMLAVTTLNDSTSEQRSIRNTNDDQNESFTESKVENNQLIASQDEQKLEQQQQPNEEEQQQEGDDDEFIRITAAHQMLTEAQTYDEQKKFPAALHLYRICVDLLLEELMFTEGTEQSRVYLREKCTAIMDRIDLLKTMLDPIPRSTSPLQSIETIADQGTTENKQETNNEDATKKEETANPLTEALDSLHIS